MYETFPVLKETNASLYQFLYIRQGSIMYQLRIWLPRNNNSHIYATHRSRLKCLIYSWIRDKVWGSNPYPFVRNRYCSKTHLLNSVPHLIRTTAQNLNLLISTTFMCWKKARINNSLT